MNAIVQTIVTLVIAIAIGTLSVHTWRGPDSTGNPDRASLLANCSWLIAILAYARVHLWWSVIPVFVWFVGAAAVAAGLLGAVLRWPDLPWLRPRKRTRRLIESTVTVLIAGAATVALSQV